MNTHSESGPKVPSPAGIAAATMVLALASLSGSALAETRGKATIDFPFVAASTPCPAGTYEFEVEGSKVTLRSTDPKGPKVVLLVVTRLGRHDKDTVPEFVFDKVGDQARLSEIWPAKEDGFLVLITPEAHEHRVGGGSNPH